VRDHRAVTTLAILSACLIPIPSLAVDTLETFDEGAWDIESYLEIGSRSLTGDCLIGYGIRDRLSAYVGTTGSDLYLGVFGSPLETDHFDLDILLGAGESEFLLAVEMNYDADPDQGSWGVYLRTGIPSGSGLLFNPGAYLTVADGHQVLLECDIRTDRDHLEVGGLALGHNVEVHENIEIVSQVCLDVPRGDNEIEARLTLGLILTIPT
jgi:hypothetical protein